MSNRRKRTGPTRNGPPSDTVIVTGVRAGEVRHPRHPDQSEPLYALEILGIPLDAPEEEITRSFVLSHEAVQMLIAELHKAEGVA